MRLPMYQVDAFASRVFAGNPAAIVPLERWLPDDVMQAIATENNLSETAFFVPRGEDYDICWFTPVAEIDLAGHPTLATAHVVLNLLGTRRDRVRFHSRKSGTLTVTRDGERLAMDFPAQPPARKPDLGDVAGALGRAPSEVLAARYGFAVFKSAEAVASLSPDFTKVAALDCIGLIATAPGTPASGVDFVSRFFAPKHSINEDPVTGSAHCTLIPYWANRLGKAKMFARQISKRGGELWCEHRGERVTIAGQCALFFEATIHV
ncbi:MAG TPA: PhzF family phenazine biosynthesis protein [Alphaproteobacteria bacterium]|jgi:PhzF family phenazine biosynthesis protein|nr:PhzF family phenazine biosynthesis protein [Alphaproteobacteria bacterium]